MYVFTVFTSLGYAIQDRMILGEEGFEFGRNYLTEQKSDCIRLSAVDYRPATLRNTNVHVTVRDRVVGASEIGIWRLDCDSRILQYHRPFESSMAGMLVAPLSLIWR